MDILVIGAVPVVDNKNIENIGSGIPKFDIPCRRQKSSTSHVLEKIERLKNNQNEEQPIVSVRNIDAHPQGCILSRNEFTCILENDSHDHSRSRKHKRKAKVVRGRTKHIIVPEQGEETSAFPVNAHLQKYIDSIVEKSVEKAINDTINSIRKGLEN